MKIPLTTRKKIKMFAYILHDKQRQSANGVPTKFKYSDVCIEEFAEKRYPNFNVVVSKEESDIKIFTYKMTPVKIEIILSNLFEIMRNMHCAELLHAKCANEDGTVDHKLYNAANQRYYAHIKNLWKRREKYIVKLFNIYRCNPNCVWIYRKGNVYNIDLNDPQIFYIHTVQTLMHKVKYAVTFERNHAKAALLLIEETGCTVTDAYKILKALTT